MKRVGILLFDEVEVLDFAGPYEVFSVARGQDNHVLYDVITISKDGSSIQARNGLSVNVDCSFTDAPKLEIVIIPGGYGTRPLLEDVEVLQWIKDQYLKVKILMTVCTGSLLLGTLGLLDDLPFCTHHMAYTEMDKIAPTAIPQKENRFIKSGKIYSSGGISAGIDLAFHILEELHTPAIAIKTAKYMEYRLVPE